MSSLLAWLVGLFGTQAGAAIGRGLTNVAAIAALAPAAIWFLENKDVNATCLTWGQLALCSLVILAILKVAHYTPPPAPPRWPTREEQ